MMKKLMDGPEERPEKVLMVCTGNICRSPMAEGIFRQLLTDATQVRVSSAGTHALIGNLATDFAVIAASENGIDISAHRARLLDVELVRESGLIFCMEPFHVEQVLELDPSAVSKTYNLAEFAANGERLKQIADPYGCSLREYRSCFADIEGCIRNFIRSHFPAY
jgi:protein-tyrosine-phosphatase